MYYSQLFGVRFLGQLNNCVLFLCKQQQQQQQQQSQHPNQSNTNLSGSCSVPVTPAAPTPPSSMVLGLSSNKMSRALYAHKLRTHTNKLKQHTNKIMSNLKGIIDIRPINLSYCALSQKGSLIIIRLPLWNKSNKTSKF